MPKEVNNELLGFLAGWVMEFGTEPVAGDRRVSNKWYSNHPVSVFDHEEYFRYVRGAGHQINQRGLAYIANGGEDERSRS